MCGCQRVTYRCLCNHKERTVERCVVYQWREQGSCLAYCFPDCHTYNRRYDVQRVCRDCRDYFYRKYGEHHYKQFIDYFLEYKEQKGWGNQAIDPRTVPRELLLKRQSAPARVGTHTERQRSRAPPRGQPFQVHQPMVASAKGSAHHVNRPPTPTVTNDSGYNNSRHPVPTAGGRGQNVSRQVNSNEDILTSRRALELDPQERAERAHDQRQVRPPTAQEYAAQEGVAESVARPQPVHRRIPRKPVPQANQQSAPAESQPVRGNLKSLRKKQRPAYGDQRPAPVGRRATPFPHSRSPSPGSEPDKVSLATALPSAVGYDFSKVSHLSQVPAPLNINKSKSLRADPSRAAVGSNKDEPLPTDPNLFVVGSDEEGEDDPFDDNYVVSSEDEEDKGGVRVFTPSPPPKYNTKKLPAGLNVVPELAHLGPGRRLQVIRRSPELQHPAPGTVKQNRKPAVRHADSVSDITVVKKFTKIAKDLHIPNVDFYEYEGRWVPRVMTPPKGKRRTRTPSPPPVAGPSTRNDHNNSSRSSTASIAIAISAGDVSDSQIPGNRNDKGAKGKAKDDKGKGKGRVYFVPTHINHASGAGETSVRVRRSPSHDSIAVPPPKRNGILIRPDSASPIKANWGASTSGDGGSGGGGKSVISNPATPGTAKYFKERGLPSQQYINEECRSATLEQTAPVLVHIPKRRYSAAVQSCYCDEGMRATGQKCPSCAERDAAAAGDLNMTWI